MHGVMEVGSELRLQANGHLDYMLAYGALDELASGCWSRAGRICDACRHEASSDDPMKFERLVLEVIPSGKLIRRFDVHQIGTYSR